MGITVGTLLLGGTALAAEETLADSVRKACNKELTTFCKGVKEGEGRVLACLYAFQDRVSDKCAYAVYDAADQLERAATALKYADTQCMGSRRRLEGPPRAGDGPGLRGERVPLRR
ncbi:MAG TPA: cysteine rich repeat-containing protein [Myxococcaceae bacterium]|nr:cysteine rich repeat-containing protein [Myxococcaceae bacterium]